MDLTEILSNSLRYPVLDHENMKKWLILGLITLAGYLIIPAIFASGYQLRAIKKTLEGDEKLPDFNEWVKMFTNGFKVIIAQLLYLIIPMILIFAGLVSIYTGSIGGALLILIGVIIAIPLYMIYSIALPNFAYHGNFWAFFVFIEIMQRIKTIGYGRFVLWWLATMLIAVVIVFIGTFVKIFSSTVEFILTPLIFTSFVALFEVRSTGLIYGESLDNVNEVIGNETE